MTDGRQEQVRQNYKAFLEMLPELLQTHQGRFALMRNGGLIEFFDTALDAATAGKRLFPDDLFSVQEVIDSPVNLGFFSYAIPERTV